MSRPASNVRALSYAQCARRCPYRADGRPHSARWFAKQVRANLLLRSNRVVIGRDVGILQAGFNAWLKSCRTTKAPQCGAVGRESGRARLRATAHRAVGS